MTDHKALAQKIKARHVMSIKPIGLYGSASKSCAWCSRNWPCDAVQLADALLEVARLGDVDWLANALSTHDNSTAGYRALAKRILDAARNSTPPTPSAQEKSRE